jgi:hypothetical protein
MMFPATCRRFLIMGLISSKSEKGAPEKAWIDLLDNCVTVHPLEVTPENKVKLEKAIGAFVGGAIRDMEKRPWDGKDDKDETGEA